MVSGLSSLRLPTTSKKQINVEYFESWDDGEVAWDIDNDEIIEKDNENYQKEKAMASYLVYHPDDTGLTTWNDRMDDGEVPWENPGFSKFNPAPSLFEFYEKIVAKEDIWGDFIDIEKVDLCEELVIAATLFAVVAAGISQKKVRQNGSSHPLSLFLLVFALVFTKNVHSAS
jgi:hypothetical protein